MPAKTVKRSGQGQCRDREAECIAAEGIGTADTGIGETLNYYSFPASH